MAKQEVRNVLTFWGDRGWESPISDGKGIDDNSRSILKGYDYLNHVVNDLSRRVTIHSVSYSHIVFPLPGPGTAVRLFATVVYTGPSALGIFGKQNPHSGEEITADTTVLEVDL
jgi:hypothetical protein